MKKKQKKIIFLLTREQWLGISILTILVVGIMVVLHYFSRPSVPSETIVNDTILTTFAAHQAEQDSLRKAQWKKKYPRDTIEIRLQTFDPNTADSSTLVRLGLKKWQVSNMLKYRDKGGRYHTAEDMKKLYGMTDSLYKILQPYIAIDSIAIKQYKDSVKRHRDSIRNSYKDTLNTDTLVRYQSHKRDTILNLRTADTTELQMIRGIGSYRAKQIIRYREQLGGFYSVNQLLEVKALRQLCVDSLSTDSLLKHFYLDSIKIQPLYVNKVSIERLEKHPYLSFEQAKAIYELRRKKVHLNNIEQLQSLDCFADDELLRLTPYLNFERKKN